jgi:hypothetical protein
MREHDLNRLYDILARLRQIMGARLLCDPGALDDCPEQGVYFFFEPGELRHDGSVSRVVRVGTHAVAHGSAATLAQRLRQHRGTLSGAGNHRGSIFRHHVGSALLRRETGRYPSSVIVSWSRREVDPEERAAEIGLEIEVSRYIGRMPLLWVTVPGPSEAYNDRRHVESNAIALLSDVGKEAIDPPSPQWLGRYADSGSVRTSGLWNVHDVDGAYDERFLEFLDACVTRMARSGPKVRSAEAAQPTTPAPDQDDRPSAGRPGGTLVLVACGQKKIFELHPNLCTVPAKDAYIGPLFSAERRVAEVWGRPWMILSAKYGFLEPTARIENYDVSFAKPNTSPTSEETLRRQVREFGLDRLGDVVVLGGTAYAAAARAAFAGTNVQVTAPVAGLPLGKMLHHLNELAGHYADPATSAYPAPPQPTDAAIHRGTAPKVADYERELATLFTTAQAEGKTILEVRSGDLHHRVAPHGPNRMPACCSAMRKMMRSNDEIVRQPPKGNGTTLVIAYQLPR